MTGAYVQIGLDRYPLTLRRAYNRETKENDGRAIEFFVTIALSETPNSMSYVRADVGAVHEHGCPSTVNGKRFGPCNCGAKEAFKKIVEAAGESYEGSLVGERSDER